MVTLLAESESKTAKLLDGLNILKFARARFVRYAGLVGLAIVGYWTAVFVATFQLLGAPVRDRTHGWLGPTPRDPRYHHCLIDIGKVNDWTCPDITPFQRHRIGCLLWLRLNGL